MAKQIHFEVFVQQGGSIKWVMHQVVDDRAAAMNSAKYALLQKEFSGAKVVKETHNLDTGEYQPITIFEEGLKEAVKRGKEEVKLPCIKPQDLYSTHARALIARVLEDALNRWGLTVKEMLHRADILEELQASGTELQHAMQKWAITQSTSQNLPVTELMKQLGDLVARGMERVFKDDRAQIFPTLNESDIASAYAIASKTPEPEYVLSGAIARALEPLTNWSDKLHFLLGFMEHLPDDDKGAAICLLAIDDFVSEMIGGRAALADFLGKQKDLGSSLALLVDLFLGDGKNPEIAANKGLKRLAFYFKQDKLRHSRSAIVVRVLDELNGIKRLCPDDIKEEVHLTRHLAKRMVLCQGPMAAIEDIVDAFEKRSARLATPEMTEEYMADAMTPDERIDMLLELEDNIIGGANKAKLVSFIIPILTGPKMEPHFMKGDVPILRRMSRLASLQARILASGFPEEEKRKVAEDFDTLSSKVEAKGKLFSSISKRKNSGAEKAVTLLRLLDAHVLTHGTCSKTAANHIAGYMRSKEFSQDLQAVEFPPDKVTGEKAVDGVTAFKLIAGRVGLNELLKKPSQNEEASREPGDRDPATEDQGLGGDREVMAGSVKG
jgi:hypothetical protein